MVIIGIVIGGAVTVFVGWFFYCRSKKSTEKLIEETAKILTAEALKQTSDSIFPNAPSNEESTRSSLGKTKYAPDNEVVFSLQDMEVPSRVKAQVLELFRCNRIYVPELAIIARAFRKAGEDLEELASLAGKMSAFAVHGQMEESDQTMDRLREQLKSILGE